MSRRDTRLIPKGNILEEVRLLAKVSFTSDDKKYLRKAFGKSTKPATDAITNAIEAGNALRAIRISEPLSANRRRHIEEGLKHARKLLKLLCPSGAESDLRTLVEEKKIEKIPNRVAAARKLISAGYRSKETILGEALIEWIGQAEADLEQLPTTPSSGGYRGRNIRWAREELLSTLGEIFDEHAVSQAANDRNKFLHFCSQFLSRTVSEDRIDDVIESL